MKVILHKLFPYAPYLNEYIGFEKEVGESDEEALKAIEHLRELAERSHREKYPHLYEDNAAPNPMNTPFPKTEEQLAHDKEKEDAINKEFEDLKEKILSAKTKAAAGQLLLDSKFKFNTELKGLVNLKPE